MKTKRTERSNWIINVFHKKWICIKYIYCIFCLLSSFCIFWLKTIFGVSSFIGSILFFVLLRFNKSTASIVGTASDVRFISGKFQRDRVIKLTIIVECICCVLPGLVALVWGMVSGVRYAQTIESSDVPYWRLPYRTPPHTGPLRIPLPTVLNAVLLRSVLPYHMTPSPA